jgi:vanillate/4-hydroxybenzoate decarboxylase subunit D
MICPRCGCSTTNLLVKSPVDDAWVIYKCRTCDFTWRSTESEDVTDYSKYDARFKIDPSKIVELPVMPPIPKLE